MKMPSLDKLKELGENQAAINKFQTYLNYIVCISDHANKTMKAEGARITSSSAYRAIETNRSPNLANIRKILFNAWTTEILLRGIGGSSDILLYQNLWSPVQLYYCCFLVTRAYFEALGTSIPHDHKRTMNTLSNIIKTRPNIFPSFLSPLCSYDTTAENYEFLNIPGVIINESLSMLSRSCRDDFYGTYTRFLRTTHSHFLAEKCDEWKARNKKQRVSSLVKKEFLQKSQPTNMLHCLYRLRIKSNYVEADPYIYTIDNKDDTLLYHESIKSICQYYLEAFEVLIIKSIRFDKYEEFIKSFRTMMPTQEIPCLERYEHYSAIFGKR